MVLDGPALISTCCHSALAARAATGAPTVTMVTAAIDRRNWERVSIENGWELHGAEHMVALLALRRVRPYAQLLVALSRSQLRRVPEQRAHECPK